MSLHYPDGTINDRTPASNNYVDPVACGRKGHYLYGQRIKITCTIEPLCFIESLLNNDINNTTFGDEDGIKQCLYLHLRNWNEMHSK